MYPHSSDRINIKNNNSSNITTSVNSDKEKDKKQIRIRGITTAIDGDDNNNNVRSPPYNENTRNIECEVNKSDFKITKNENDKTLTTPSNRVTSVTSVTAKPSPPQYPCYFCGTNYKTNIDFDMALHLLEFHKQQLLKLPMRGNLDAREDYLIKVAKINLQYNSTIKEFSEDDETY